MLTYPSDTTHHQQAPQARHSSCSCACSWPPSPSRSFNSIHTSLFHLLEFCGILLSPQPREETPNLFLPLSLSVQRIKRQHIFIAKNSTSEPAQLLWMAAHSNVTDVKIMMHRCAKGHPCAPCNTCGFIRCSPSNFSHHQSWHLSSKLQEVRKFLCHCTWRSISKHLNQEKNGCIKIMWFTRITTNYHVPLWRSIPMAITSFLPHAAAFITALLRKVHAVQSWNPSFREVKSDEWRGKESCKFSCKMKTLQDPNRWRLYLMG